MRRPAGFTLIEVLLALALIALVAGVMFAMLVDMGQRERRVTEHADRLGRLADVHEILARALGGSMVATGDGGAGISGGGGELRVVHRGVAPAGDDGVLDLVDLTLRWEMASGDVECTHELVGGDSASEVVLSGVSWLSVRFHDGAAWAGSYDSAAAGALPSAVEVAVWFGPPPETLAVPGAPAPLEEGADDGAIPLEAMFADEFEGTPAAAGAADALEQDVAPPTRAPDRRLILAVPDAPRARGDLFG